MKLMFKLVALTGIVWAAVLADRKLRPRLRAVANDTLGVSPLGEIFDADLITGIADVDPQPLTQIAGDGIDLDATEAAHHDIPAQRDRLPIAGKTIS